MSTLPVRKQLRLPNFDYSAFGTYHITICTKKRSNYFWQTTHNLHSTEEIKFSEMGHIVEMEIQNLTSIHQGVTVDNYSIMPDHLHLLLTIHHSDATPPTVPSLINQFKGSISRKIGSSIWQRGYNDHIIRNEQDYREKWRYIDENPLRYILDGNR